MGFCSVSEHMCKSAPGYKGPARLRITTQRASLRARVCAGQAQKRYRSEFRDDESGEGCCASPFCQPAASYRGKALPRCTCAPLIRLRFAWRAGLVQVQETHLHITSFVCYANQGCFYDAVGNVSGLRHIHQSHIALPKQAHGPLPLRSCLDTDVAYRCSLCPGGFCSLCRLKDSESAVRGS